MYELSKDEHDKLLSNNITKTYRKCSSTAKRHIDKEARELSKHLELDNRMEQYAERNAFITLKDHKDNFTRNLPCRLINPSKSEMGRVAKACLDKIVQDITAITNANQWRNTSSVIQWFNSIKCKSKSRFIKFDIAEFYPSISEDLHNNSLKYASGFTTIPDKAITISNMQENLFYSTEMIYGSRIKTTPCSMCQWVAMMALRYVSLWGCTCWTNCHH